MNAEKRLNQLGITLPQVSSPAANYVNAVQTGNLLYLAGKGPLPVDGKRPSGKLGRDGDNRRFRLREYYPFRRREARGHHG